ncbi:Nin one binding Zn-ribbon like-domain-containing protein [Dactylonectria macrodidyma]|uniref:20S-pre-rRNA D-site endonuclease NOB1 n=1 Tax=Dactylonectria macrodidyma TaxID=307937 RepID=A0A9P9EFY6_9HYPO|nr:Nin one binding Zn-ribbon like-domain-containing protein [Dactylonectria macrodidyma]
MATPQPQDVAAPVPAPAPETTTPSSSSTEPAFKPIHSLVLDTGPLIKNDPPASTLRAKAEQLYTLPCIVNEIRDAATRSRVQTTLLPFVTLRSPGPESVKFVTAFARRTGDLAVLSRPDIEVLALGYELECERNGGDWRLRNMPGQKTLNGKPNKDKPEEAASAEPATDKTEEATTGSVDDNKTAEIVAPVEGEPVPEAKPLEDNVQQLTLEAETQTETQTEQPVVDEAVEKDTQAVPEAISAESQPEATVEDVEEDDEDDGEASDDEGGWITPSNLKKHQGKGAGAALPAQTAQKTLQAAVLTSDYAMQNVALRMNLNLVAPSLARITHLKNWVLRCHGCFTISKDMDRQFCPSCGQPTLNRVSCSTDANGNFKVHLKKNFQWNNRGNVYSVPRPVHGSSNGRLAKGAGGQGNWGTGLVLAEDQKEYTRAAEEQRRARKKDLMDQDYLPDLLTGRRQGSGGKIRVGAGRNVNSKRKH